MDLELAINGLFEEPAAEAADAFTNALHQRRQRTRSPARFTSVPAVAMAAAVLGDKEDRLAEAVAAVEQGPPGACDGELLVAAAAADQDLEDAKEAHSEAAVAASALVNEVSFELRRTPVLASL